MRAFVFTDKALARHAGQFVWLSIDTEKARNAPFVQKYPIRAWPSFYVIDPTTETVAVRWVGGATVAQLESATREIVADHGLRLSADDRSALYDGLVSARDDAKDEEGARRIARQWAAELEGDAERAKTPEQRTALDPNRLNAYVSAGE